MQVNAIIKNTIEQGQGLSVVIPAYNEEAAIASVVEGIKTLLESTQAKFEILVVDDGSFDRTAELAKTAGAKVILHQSNRGYGAALKTGINQAKYDLIAMADADGQHDANQLASLLYNLQEADVAIGTRTPEATPWIRKPGKLILQWVANWLTGRQIPDLNSGLRVMRRQAIAPYLYLTPDGFSFSTTTTIAFIHNDLLIRWVPIQVKPRQGRPSSVKIVEDGLKTLLLIVRLVAIFAPLRVFLLISLLLLVLAFIGVIWGIKLISLT